MRFRFLFVLLIIGLDLPAQNRQTVQEYIARYKDMAINEMKTYKIPASITLAQGVLESGNGNSELAKNANNYFGIKCKAEWNGEKYYYDDDEENECFRKYTSDSASYRDHSLFLSQRIYYKSLFQLDICDYKAWAFGLKKAGYATEPMYAELLIKIIEENKLYLIDCPDKYKNMDTALVITPIIEDSLSKVTKNNNHKETITEIREKSPNSENSGSDFGEVILSGNSRKIYFNNGVKYVKARSKDSYNDIAKDFDMSVQELIHYNDLKTTKQLSPGERVYIEIKRKKSNTPYHIVKAGETLRGISQLYGVQLKEICSKNKIKVSDSLKVGQKIWLKHINEIK